MNNINYLEKYGPKLIKQGYGVIPIVYGKKYPKEKEWQKIVATKEDIPAWVKKGYANVGVLCKNTPCVDLDIRNKELSIWMKDQIHEKIGKTPIRVGMPPKALLPFRTDKPFRKMSSKKFKDLKGVEHQVEILSQGNQFVAFGIHPETSKPYKWDRELVDIDWNDLPTLTLEQGKEIIHIFETECKRRKWTAPSSGESLTKLATQTGTAAPYESFKEMDAALAVDPGRMGISEEKMAGILKSADPEEMEYDDWLKVGMGIYHQTEGSQEGYQMWIKWSERSSKHDTSEMEKKWKSFKTEPERKPVTFRTVMKWAKETQKTSPGPKSMEFTAWKAKDARLHIQKGEWLFKGVMKQNSIGCFFGPPGSFKSYLAMDLALHCASGLDWHGRKLKKSGPVLYILGEMQEEFFERLDAWEKLKGIDAPEENLHISNMGISLCDHNAAKKVDEAIEKIAEEGEPPVLVVVDTVNKNFGGDENSASEMSKFLMHIEEYIKQRYGCTVLLVHHTGHANTDRGRGSSALPAGLDFEYKVHRPTRDGNKVRLTCTKTRGRDDWQEVWFEGEAIILDKDEDGEIISNLVFKSIPKPRTKETDAPSKKAKNLLELTKKLADAKGKVNRKKLKIDAFNSGVATSDSQFWSNMKSLKDQGMVAYKKGNSPIMLNFDAIQGANNSSPEVVFEQLEK